MAGLPSESIKVILATPSTVLEDSQAGTFAAVDSRVPSRVGGCPMTIFIERLIKLIFVVMILLLSASLAIAESDDSSTDSTVLEDIVIYSQMPEPQDYKYGMRLDIAEVIAMEYFPPEPNFCGVIPAQMTYEDSTGELNTIRYLYPETAGCHDQ